MKKWSSKDVELTPLENRNEQEQNKIVEKGTKKNGESKKNDKKKKMNEGTTKKILHKNDPWSDHPETQFGPTYPFFRNLEPRPTLRAVKVHFD